MRGVAGIAVFGCALGGANAKFLKWSEYESQRWLPAQQTLGAMLDLKGVTPKPTPGPRLEPGPPSLERRDSNDNTCAYVNGKFTSSLYCDTTDACVYNSRWYYIGCCPETSITCPIPTTCYDSTDSSKFTTNNGYTLYCGDSKYQHCITHKYAADDSLFSGYTLLGCAVAAGSDTVYYDAKDTTTGVSKSLKAGNTATNAFGTNGGGAVTVTVDPSNSQTTSAGPGLGGGSSTPVAAIAGGVVGGVAGLALIGVGIWLIVRHSNKKNQNQTPTAAAAVPGSAWNQPPPPPQQGQPPMGQYSPPAGHYDPKYQAPPPAGFAPMHDPRASIAKPPYDVTNTNSMYQPSYSNSPPASPPPQTPHTPVYNHDGTPPPQQGAHYPSGYSVSTMPGSPPSQGQPGFPGQPPIVQHTPGGYAPPQGYQYAAELPTQRGDGEVRELAG